MNTISDSAINDMIFDRIEEDYLSLICLDLDSGMFRVIKDSMWHNGLSFEDVTDFSLAAKAFAKPFKKDYRDVIEKYSNTATFKERFASDNKASFTFESPFESQKGWIDIAEYVISRHDDGTPALVSIAFSAADSDTIRETELQKRLRSYVEIVGGLAQEFDALHIITLDESDFLPYIQNKGYEDDLVALSAPGVSWSQALVASVTPMIHPDYLDEVMKYADKTYIRSLLKNKRRHSIRIRLKKELAGTEFFWYEFVIIKLDDIDKEASRIAMGFIDIDDQARKEFEQQEKLSEALSQAQSSNRAKTIFLNNMSHDIRTPINAIIGYSGLAFSRIDNKDKVSDCLEKIKQSSEHLLSLINEVLDMSRIESGNVSLSEKEERLSGIIDSLCDITNIHIESNRLSFSLHKENVTDDNIICDKVRLTQVLINILSNAITCRREGGVDRKGRASEGNRGRHICVYRQGYRYRYE